MSRGKKQGSSLEKRQTNTPFLSTNGIQLIHGDFNDKSKGIPDNSIDPMFTNPPYAVEDTLFQK